MYRMPIANFVAVWGWQAKAHSHCKESIHMDGYCNKATASSERSMRKAIFVKVLEKKPPKNPRKHTSSKKTTTNLTLHVCTLKYQCNSLVEIPATAEQHSLYFQLRQQLQHIIIFIIRENLGLRQS